jgi:anti-sigma B factor antagonist
MVMDVRNPIFAPASDIDMATSEQFRSLLEPLVAGGGLIVLDMTRVTFMDSSGIRVLIETAAAVGDRGCIVLHGVRRAVRQIIEMTGLEVAAPNIHVLRCSSRASA